VLYVVVAWRIARLMRLGRNCPDLDAQLAFEPDEWKAAYILDQKKLPDKTPTLNEVVRLIARLGSFLTRKGDSEPGVKTIWLDIQRMLDFAAGIRFSTELQSRLHHAHFSVAHQGIHVHHNQHAVIHHGQTGNKAGVNPGIKLGSRLD
jgi:hypothetical protein